MSKRDIKKSSLVRVPLGSASSTKKFRKVRKLKADYGNLHKSTIYYVAEEPNSRLGILEKFLEFLMKDKIETRVPITRKISCDETGSLESSSGTELGCVISKEFRELEETDLHDFGEKSNSSFRRSTVLNGLKSKDESSITDAKLLESQLISDLKPFDVSLAPLPLLLRLEKIIFTNGNVYEGPTNQYLFHGNGKFTWDDKTTYYGDFTKGYLTGKGEITLPDLSTYEGDFCNGFFHGKGLLKLSSTPLCYNGDWKHDLKDGKGWIMYGENDYYEGEWKNDMRHGSGYRNYKNGAKYKGDWVENKKQGNGKMLFSNDDYYNGEWLEETLHGYGEYVWDMICNKTFCFPVYNWYKGAWRNGERHGVGIMNFGTECGAKYAGLWRNNYKHGPGVMVCGNGLIMESFPLFLYDKPVHKHAQINLTQFQEMNEDRELPKGVLQQTTSSYYDILELINTHMAYFELDEYILAKIIKNSENIPPENFCKLEECKETWQPLNLPTHTTAEEVDLKYFIDLVMDEALKETTLEDYVKQFDEVQERGLGTGFYKNTFLVSNYNREESTENEAELNDPLQKLLAAKNKEVKTLKNTIINYLPKLRNVYDKYATFAKSKSIMGDVNLDFKPILVRFFLWQLLRDVGVAEQGIQLVDVDALLWDNPSTCLDTKNYPFEPIYFYQYILYLFGAAWLCFKADQHSVDQWIPSGIFRNFLDTKMECVEMFRGSSVGDYLNLVSLNDLYDVFRTTSEPMTVKSFLNATYGSKDEQMPCYDAIRRQMQPNVRLRDGFNAVPVAHDVCFIRESPRLSERLEECETLHGPTTLFTFKTLGKKSILEAVMQICPKFVPKNTSYKITFLEFYEIVLLLALEKAEGEIKKGHFDQCQASSVSEISYKTKSKKKKLKSINQ